MFAMLGECVEYEGAMMVVASAESDGEDGGSAILEERLNDGAVEMPMPFERFMADGRLRITQIDTWGHCFVPSDGPA